MGADANLWGVEDVTDRKLSDVAALKSSSLPLVMYGAGSYAVDVARFLEKHNITIDACCVDAAYVRPDQLFLDRLPIGAVEDVLQSVGECNIVIGFADYVKARQVLSVFDNATIYFIDAPNQEGFFDYAFIKAHEAEFRQTYEKLYDQKSRDIFSAFLRAKVSGDPTPLYDFADFNQYFSEPVVLGEDEVLVDCGAYTGDTIRSLLKNTNGKYGQIIAFEPEDQNFAALTEYIDGSHLSRVVSVKAGAWSGKDTLYFSPDGNTAAIIDPGKQDGVEIAVDSIDNVVPDQDAVTYIKMDIEGAELEALKGAAETIRRSHPKLAICVYHKPEDLITIPQYILSLSDDYDVYLRHHQYMSWEMVLYALPRAAKG